MLYNVYVNFEINELIYYEMSYFSLSDIFVLFE